MPAQAKGKQAVVVGGQQAKEAALVGAGKAGEMVQVVAHAHQCALLTGHVDSAARGLYGVEVL
ncbi:hypothetical protein D3C76_1643900 [compost metagenome]